MASLSVRDYGDGYGFDSHFCKTASSCAESGVLFFGTYALSKDLYLFLLECFAVRGKWVNFVFGGFAVCVL